MRDDRRKQLRGLFGPPYVTDKLREALCALSPEKLREARGSPLPKTLQDSLRLQSFEKLRDQVASYVRDVPTLRDQLNYASCERLKLPDEFHDLINRPEQRALQEQVQKIFAWPDDRRTHDQFRRMI